MRLTIWVFVLLGLAWAVVLVPAVSRPRIESSPLNGVRDFEQAMGILANTRSGERRQMPGRWVMVPKGMGHGVKTRRDRLIRKRRTTFERLLVAAVLTLLLGLIPMLRSLLWAHLALDVAVVGYVIQLRRWRLNEVQRKRVVREIPRTTEPNAAPLANAAMAVQEVSDDTAETPRARVSGQ